MKLKIIISLTIIILLQSCGIFGIHFNLHNPKKPGKSINFSKETILLGELTKYRDCFDVYYYDLSVDFDPDNKIINGSVEIHATAINDFDTIQIDLHPNLNITSLKNIVELNYKREERAVFISLKKKKGDAFIIKINYNGCPIIAKKPPWIGGFVWEKDKQGNHWDGVACESIGASIWWPLKDHNTDEPDSMRLHYTVPKGLTAIGNGQLENISEKEITSTFNWFISYPINTYNVTFYIGKYKLLEDEYIGVNNQKLKLNHYVLEPNYNKAKIHFKQLHSQLSFFEKRFGEYPWYRDGFKLIESPYAGMEHQSAIAYGNGYKNDLDSVTDYIILHETAHEWWGNSLTAKDMNDVWLHEGFATYAEALYLEHEKGLEAYNSHLNLYRIFIKNKYPVVGVKDRMWFHYKKSSDVYVKGAWILHTLRTQINNDVIFFDIIKTFATRYKYKIVESKDFIELVNEKTNDDYNWFFYQYLFKNKVPVLECGTSYDGKFYYRWRGEIDSSFDKLKLKLKSGENEIIFKPSKNIQMIQLPKNNDGSWSYFILLDNLFAFKKNKYLPGLYTH